MKLSKDYFGDVVPGAAPIENARVGVQEYG